MRTTNKNVWTCLQIVSHSSFFLCRSDLLTRVVEYLSRKWVTSNVWANQNHWQEWMTALQESELLFSVCANQIHWQELPLLRLGCKLLLLPKSQCIPLTFFQAHSLAIFLNPYFMSNDSSGPSSIISSITSSSKLEPPSSLIYFTGQLNPSLPVLLFSHIISLLMPTALLICMENTFWNISRYGNFVKSFKKSFTLYVESGMRMKLEADIDILGHPSLATDEFKEKFFIIGHYLRKFHCFYLQCIFFCTQHI